MSCGLMCLFEKQVLPPCAEAGAPRGHSASYKAAESALVPQWSAESGDRTGTGGRRPSSVTTRPQARHLVLLPQFPQTASPGALPAWEHCSALHAGSESHQSSCSPFILPQPPGSCQEFSNFPLCDIPILLRKHHVYAHQGKKNYFAEIIALTRYKKSDSLGDGWFEQNDLEKQIHSLISEPMCA